MVRASIRPSKPCLRGVSILPNLRTRNRRSNGRVVTWSGNLQEEADRRVVDVLATADLDRPGHPLLDRAEAVFTILEHEAMHQETLLYMWQRLHARSEVPSRGISGRRSGASAA